MICLNVYENGPFGVCYLVSTSRGALIMTDPSKSHVLRAFAGEVNTDYDIERRYISKCLVSLKISQIASFLRGVRR